jgi:very-short-patch-repair endonuclease
LRFDLKPGWKKVSSLEDKFAEQLRECGFKGRYRRNHPFLEGRRFRADFWLGALLLVVEVDGGEWLGKNGGHTSGAGMRADRERDGLAALQHIQTIRYVGAQVKDGSAIGHLIQYIPIRAKEVEALKEKGLI